MRSLIRSRTDPSGTSKQLKEEITLQLFARCLPYPLNIANTFGIFQYDRKI